MIYRRLGKAGVQVSALSLGAWLTFGKQIDNSTAERLMGTAYDHGVNFFDNAEQYAGGQAEEVMGQLLERFNWDRSTYLVSSKVFWGGQLPNQKGLSRKHVIEACHAALKRLRVDYLDFYFCHRPDVNTPMEETVRAMTDLIHQGKVLYWGTSMWSGVEIMEAYQVARQYNLIPPTMEQPQYHMFYRERVEKEYRKLYDTMGMGTTIWSPLGSGLLTGKYGLGNAPEGSRAVSHPDYGWLKNRLIGEEARQNLERVDQLKPLAQDLGLSLPVMAIAWVLKNPNVSTAILGASKVEQLQENLQAVQALDHMSPEVMERIEEILGNKPIIPAY